MKRLAWLSLIGALSLATGRCEQQKLNHQQDGVFGMYYLPKWYSDAIVAANCYQAGVADISSDPTQAINYFRLGLQYAHAAVALGGGQSAESISSAISREMPIAENNLKNAPRTDNPGNDEANNTGNADNGTMANGQVQIQAHTSAPKANPSVQSGSGLSHLGGSQTSTGRQRG